MPGFDFSIIRIGGTVVLGIVILFVYLAYLMASTTNNNLLSEDFYANSLSENRLYDRFYDEVLLDEGFRSTRKEVLGNFEIAFDEEAIGLVKQILPPEYLQSQVESSISANIRYLKKETDSLDLIIDLGPPLDRAKPVILGYIDGKIDNLSYVPVNNLDEFREELEAFYGALQDGRVPSGIPVIDNLDKLINDEIEVLLRNVTPVEVTTPWEFAENLTGIYASLASGQAPSAIPDISNTSRLQREAFILAYEGVIPALAVDSSIPEDQRDQLSEAFNQSEAAIKAEIRDGRVDTLVRIVAEVLVGPLVVDYVATVFNGTIEDLVERGRLSVDAKNALMQQEAANINPLIAANVKGSLKIIAKSLAEPLVDEATGQIRDGLVRSGDGGEPRLLDLVQEAADQEGVAKDAFLDNLRAEDIRRAVGTVGLGAKVLMFIMVISCLGVAAVHLPHVASSLRWLGAVLLTTALVSVIIGIVLRALLLGLADSVAVWEPGGAGGSIPSSMVTILNDVLTFMVRDIAGDWIRSSVMLAVAGAALVIASFVARKLGIPFLSR